MWGQAQGAAVFFRDEGIIPTRVGTSLPLQKLPYPNKDHPHACGDKFTMLADILYNSGSSPRVWGQAYSGGNICNELGIIPTRVGTSDTE